jgi:hypothetical protein
MPIEAIKIRQQVPGGGLDEIKIIDIVMSLKNDESLVLPILTYTI